MGCGTGVIATCAALAGCDRVVAVDVNPQAVVNSQRNASRHGVADRLDSIHSDLFDALDGAERFDVVFWHSNYVLAPDDYRYANVHERAYVDAGYVTHRRYLEQAPRWLTPGGRALLHFSARGDLDELRRIAVECNRQLHIRRSAVFLEGEQEVEHLLIEVATRAGQA
ncbi:Methyltransferase domain-containing protein [Micromonospora auratinigra]|uniref:Methyltransferase domain-containing protein n=2 Tax=Micromonospora auratinigra TaxID=261654 RepID=A0A1A8ZIG3_9ACTN|nr:Methyltransferase domain-containing protein [Micromonospora auratinigra]